MATAGGMWALLTSCYIVIRDFLSYSFIQKDWTPSINELVSRLWYKLAYAYSEDSNKSGHLHRLNSLSFLSEETLEPWLPIENPPKADQSAWRCRLIWVLHWHSGLAIVPYFTLCMLDFFQYHPGVDPSQARHFVITICKGYQQTRKVAPSIYTLTTCWFYFLAKTLAKVNCLWLIFFHLAKELATTNSEQALPLMPTCLYLLLDTSLMMTWGISVSWLLCFLCESACREEYILC